jgi:predicted XRE-type DNA-binding protein
MSKLPLSDVLSESVVPTDKETRGLTRAERYTVREFFRRNYGAQAAAAEMLEIQRSTIGKYLHGRIKSSRLDREILGCVERLRERYTK